MWLLAEYLPTTLFSLKPAWATSSGGKSLLLPTPFAVKMALLDAVYRAEGAVAAEEAWGLIRALTIALRGPDHIVVTNTFTKILKPRRGEADAGSAHAGPFQKTIGYREYVYFSGTITIGLEIGDHPAVDRLMSWLVLVNYLGKRGSFVQLVRSPSRVDDLPDGFVVACADGDRSFRLDGIMHLLDDTSSALSLDQANIYGDAPIRLGKDRILRQVILPYRLVRSSKGYSHYQRIE